MQDDNFDYEIEDQGDLEFYNDVQRLNVEKQCARCGRTVMILPHYDICGSCADNPFPE